MCVCTKKFQQDASLTECKGLWLNAIFSIESFPKTYLLKIYVYVVLRKLLLTTVLC